MSKVTLAIRYHYMEQANHEYCPKDKNSWCSFKRDEATEENTHKPIKDTIPANISTLFQHCLLVDNVKSTLKQCCVFQRWNLQHRTTSNQRCVFQRGYEQR